MPKLTDISYIKTLLGAFGFTFSKQLGQNFLIDPTVCPKMAEMCGAKDIGVIEIGPGIGVLTKELSAVAKKQILRYNESTQADPLQAQNIRL
mgnify:CR=1 FL=1